MKTPDMFTELTHPENVSKKDEFLYTCCKRPQVSALSETRTSISDEGRYVSEPWVNKICLNCYSHIYGHPENPRYYTRKEWDDWINSIEW